MTEPTGATLHFAGGELELPRLKATEGNDGYDVSKLLKQTGTVTLDPGFVNTAATTSAITYIDGDAGILRYRGYPIEQLAENSSFLEVSYLLIYGELPTPGRARRLRPAGSAGTRCCTRTSRASSTASRATRTRCRCCPPPCRRCRPSTRTASTRSTTSRSRSPPSACWPSCRPSPPTRYKKTVGQPFLYPDNSLALVENFLRMTFGFPAEPYELDPTVVKALDLLLILHADHEQNCSTSTVRLVGSLQRQPVRLGLRRHQRAVRPAARRRQPGRARDAPARSRTAATTSTRSWSKVKNKEDGVQLMGFGHRVYKNYDPRAAIIKKTADEILTKLGVNDPLLDIALQLEQIALDGRLLRRAQALPERRLLHRPDLQGHGLPDEDVHRAVRPRPPARAGSPSGAR